MTIYILLYHHNDINNDYASIEAVSTNYHEIKNKFNKIKKGLLNKDLILTETYNNYAKFSDKHIEMLYELEIVEKSI